MLTNEDIQKLLEVLATKEDVIEIKKDIVDLREAIQGLSLSVDKLVKGISDLTMEYSAMNSQLNRHEKWIRQVAEKLEIKLDY
ncbi:MAG: hypothetical protein PHH17_02050 [Candidatus Pacebacteria bacterium]|jgi:uncharacterized coiled-coil DUF342 family protein|nr:hypothetical protein [Candidatus Paceibacterota bacterium]MDD3072752.1 hypothetical protein [Candidatus Paceibacterota bacterium]MDD3729195.1 hypothetical protein [Candidatus Paceibacterota bacterium]MDD4897473.1 hypothetical protein [Candidatus Paceibacterota bacterium]MDD5445968.1 hypothetical protein [Candidatus Paceibacterota bacterium]